MGNALIGITEDRLKLMMEEAAYRGAARFEKDRKKLKSTEWLTKEEAMQKLGGVSYHTLRRRVIDGDVKMNTENPTKGLPKMYCSKSIDKYLAGK